jgi:hypothetical protein
MSIAHRATAGEPKTIKSAPASPYSSSRDAPHRLRQRILRRPAGRDSQPAGKLHIALENNRLHEIWLPPLPEELEFLDRYGVHPEAGERIEVPDAGAELDPANRAPQSGRACCSSSSITATPATNSSRVATAARSWRIAITPPVPTPIRLPANKTSPPTSISPRSPLRASKPVCAAKSCCTQSQFLMGIGEKNQFADAFEDCRVPQERAKVALQLKASGDSGRHGREFSGADRQPGNKTAALSGMSFGRSSQRFSVLRSDSRLSLTSS